jgi:hypothetical protein
VKTSVACSWPSRCAAVRRCGRRRCAPRWDAPRRQATTSDARSPARSHTTARTRGAVAPRACRAPRPPPPRPTPAWRGRGRRQGASGLERRTWSCAEAIRRGAWLAGSCMGKCRDEGSQKDGPANAWMGRVVRATPDQPPNCFLHDTLRCAKRPSRAARPRAERARRAAGPRPRRRSRGTARSRAREADTRWRVPSPHVLTGSRRPRATRSRPGGAHRHDPPPAASAGVCARPGAPRPPGRRPDTQAVVADQLRSRRTIAGAAPALPSFVLAPARQPVPSTPAAPTLSHRSSSIFARNASCWRCCSPGPCSSWRSAWG